MLWLVVADIIETSKTIGEPVDDIDLVVTTPDDDDVDEAPGRTGRC